MTADKGAPILIVTTFRENAALIRRVLHGLGFKEVVEVPDAEAAMVKLQEWRCGLVIADANIEPNGGMSLLQEMRTSENLSCVPFILTAADVNKEIVVAANPSYS